MACEPWASLRLCAHLAFSSDKVLVHAKTPGTVKVAKKKTIVYTAFSDILTWKPVANHSSRNHTSAMPLQRHWCRGTCFLLPRQKLFLKRCDSCTPEVNRP